MPVRETDTITPLSEVRNALRPVIRDAKIGDLIWHGWWPSSRGGILGYNGAFADLLAPEIDKQKGSTYQEGHLRDTVKAMTQRNLNPIGEYVALQKERNQGNVRVLDLMSYGQLLRNLKVPGVAVAKEDRRTENDKKLDMAEDRKLLTEDILQPTVWRTLRQQCKENGQFDMIFCRPLGALAYVPQDRHIYALLLKRVYRLLSSNNGVFLTQVHKGMRSFMKEACTRLSEIPGVTAQLKGSRFMLVKTQEAPSILSYRDVNLKG